MARSRAVMGVGNVLSGFFLVSLFLELVHDRRDLFNKAPECGCKGFGKGFVECLSVVCHQNAVPVSPAIHCVRPAYSNLLFSLLGTSNSSSLLFNPSVYDPNSTLTSHGTGSPPEDRWKL